MAAAPAERRSGLSLLRSHWPAWLDVFAWVGRISETRYWAWLMLLPGFLLISVVIFYPVISGIWLSLHEYNLLRPARGQPFVGLQQFIDLLADEKFWLSLRNTAYFGVFNVINPFLLGLIIALALKRAVRGAGLVRTLILMPWFMPSVVAGHMWALLLDSRLGVINDILVKLGLLESYWPWFARTETAMPAILLVGLWRGFPFFALLLLAGLQSISQEMYEAAAVDGANAMSRFRHITIPLLLPVIVVAITLRTIAVVNSPDLMIILTGGGPGLATHVLSFYAFQTAYAAFDFGYAAALSVVMLGILIFFTLIYLRVAGVDRD
ncbi:MAG: sugar ABC transporter permease [Anaerolineaceae bacterium]|nr:sugar ABC transporter permease [Anaerolineaceae bacterium]